VSDRVFKVKKNPLYRDTSRIARLLEEYRPQGEPANDDDEDANGPEAMDSGRSADCGTSDKAE
jgi:hypothetical protein